MNKATQRWFITWAYRNHKYPENPTFTSEISDVHPAEFILECVGYDDGNYWVVFAMPYDGDLPTGEIYPDSKSGE